MSENSDSSFHQWEESPGVGFESQRSFQQSQRQWQNSEEYKWDSDDEPEVEEAHHSFEDEEELNEIAQEFMVDDKENWRESVGSCVFQRVHGLCLSVEVDLHY